MQLKKKKKKKKITEKENSGKIVEKAKFNGVEIIS